MDSPDARLGFLGANGRLWDGILHQLYCHLLPRIESDSFRINGKLIKFLLIYCGNNKPNLSTLYRLPSCLFVCSSFYRSPWSAPFSVAIFLANRTIRAASMPYPGPFRRRNGSWNHQLLLPLEEFCPSALYLSRCNF